MNKMSPLILSFTAEKYQCDISKIRTTHMNSDEKRAIINWLKEYCDIFRLDDK